MVGFFYRALTLAVLLLATGCRFAVMVPSEGNVLSSSGQRDCMGPDYCEFDITDPGFSETFTAVARPGYEFMKWQDGAGFSCADETNPVCTVEMPDETTGAIIVSLFRTGSLRPLFRAPAGVDTDGDGVVDDQDDDDDNDGLSDSADSCPLDGPDRDGFGCPYFSESETVRVVDDLWAQPILFEGITWHEVNDVCPGPSGVCVGRLRDIDVTGWIWASGDEVTALLNGFFGTSLGPVPDYIYDTSEWELSPNIFDYFQAYSICCTSDRIYGWLREQANIVEGYHYGVDCNDQSNDSCRGIRIGAATDGIELELIPKVQVSDGVGVWLRKPIP